MKSSFYLVAVLGTIGFALGLAGATTWLQSGCWLLGCAIVATAIESRKDRRRSAR